MIYSGKKILIVYNPLAYDILPIEALNKIAQITNWSISLIIPKRFGFDNKNIKESDITNYRGSYPAINTISLNLLHPTNTFFRTLFSLRLLFEINSIKPDIIHCFNEIFSPTLTEVILLSKMISKNIKIINYNAENIFWNKFPFNQFGNFNSRFVDCAPYINRDSGELIRRYKPDINKKRMILSVDTGKFTFTRHSSEDIKQINIFYVGRMLKDKGIYTLLKAFQQLEERYRLHFIGSGPEMENIRKYIYEHNLQDRCILAGSKTREEINALFKDCQILVLPSLTTKTLKEQFGRVIIEAMACGVPVIGSSSGAIPEVIGDCGLIFREGNPDDLKGKVEMLLSDPEMYNKLCILGRKAAEEKYSLDIFVENLIDIYNAV